ncbi:MAG: hypothetical protein ACLGJB_25000 [Blastocatellia bacterium]
MIASLSESRKGSGRSRRPFTILKIAVLAPMPNASVMMAMIVKPGFFTNILSP